MFFGSSLSSPSQPPSTSPTISRSADDLLASKASEAIRNLQTATPEWCLGPKKKPGNRGRFFFWKIQVDSAQQADLTKLTQLLGIYIFLIRKIMFSNCFVSWSEMGVCEATTHTHPLIGDPYSHVACLHFIIINQRDDGKNIQKVCST